MISRDDIEAFEAMNKEPECEVCRNGDLVPTMPDNYWRCPSCDSEWWDED